MRWGDGLDIKPSGRADVAQQKPINMTHLITLVSVTILVGTEFVGTSWAAGWALGGLFQLPLVISRIVELAFALFGVVCLYYFVRAAAKAEPIRG
jgi:uncharacterized membrane protein